MADLARAAVGLLAWTAAVFGACATALALAGITRAAAVCCVVATVAAVGVYVTPSGTPRASVNGYGSSAPGAPRHAGDA